MLPFGPDLIGLNFAPDEPSGPVAILECTCEDPVETPTHVPGSPGVELLAYYPLGDQEGTDVSGNRNDATPQGEDSQTKAGVLCLPADWMQGRRWYTTDITLDDVFTVSVWVRLQKVKLEQTVIAIGDNVRVGFSWRLEPIVWINERTADEVVVVADPIDADALTHVAFIRDGNKISIVVDGVQQSLLVDGQPADPALVDALIDPATVTIAHYRGGAGIHGTIQDLAIREVVMTPAELKQERDSFCEAVFELAPE